MHLKVLVATVVFLAASPIACQTVENCGNAGDVPGAYGPFDYRTATRDQKYLVEITGGHFTPSVEALKSGTTGTLSGELNYTLNAFPNHPRALMAMIRLGQREKTAKPLGSRHTIECWVERAIEFRPDDVNVRQIRGVYYSTQRKYKLAVADFEFVVEEQPGNANAHYNLGLAYFETGDYDRALTEAHRASALGFPLQGLQDKLKAKGKWQE